MRARIIEVAFEKQREKGSDENVVILQRRYCSYQHLSPSCSLRGAYYVVFQLMELSISAIVEFVIMHKRMLAYHLSHYQPRTYVAALGKRRGR